MKNIKLMNSKEVKSLLKAIDEQYSCKFDGNYAFLMGKDNKIFVVNKDISKIDFEKLRVNSLGSYFCEFKDNVVRFSVEGSQMVGKTVKKNVLDLDDKQIALWVRGNDIEVSNDVNAYVIVSNNRDYFGCGRVKDGKLLNFYPKTRRINSAD